MEFAGIRRNSFPVGCCQCVRNVEKNVGHGDMRFEQQKDIYKGTAAGCEKNTVDQTYLFLHALKTVDGRETVKHIPS
jgi:hypothetical protein